MKKTNIIQCNHIALKTQGSGQTNERITRLLMQQEIMKQLPTSITK